MAELTLRQCLEHVAQLGTDYLVTDQEREWPATALLTWLVLNHLADLDLPMYLRLPDAKPDGAICELTPRGGFLLRYRIERRTPR
jgi:hypothetical protein